MEFENEFINHAVNPQSTADKLDTCPLGILPDEMIAIESS
jgi:hypothetical protein